MKKGLFILILFLINCTNSTEDQTNSNNPIDPTDSTQVIGLLPVYVKYTKDINENPYRYSEINYDGNKIISIKNVTPTTIPTNNLTYEFTYDGNNIIKIKSNQFDGFSEPQFYYLAYENNKLKRIIKETPNGGSDPFYYTDFDITLDWINDTNVKYKVPFDTNITSGYVYYELFFDTNGNLIKSTEDKDLIIKRYSTTHLYEYNSPINSAFKNVAGFDKLNGIVNLFLGLAKHNYSHVFPSEFLFTNNNLTKINSNVKTYNNSGTLEGEYNLEYKYNYEADSNNYTKKFITIGQPSNTTSVLEYTYGN